MNVFSHIVGFGTLLQGHLELLRVWPSPSDGEISWEGAKPPNGKGQNTSPSSLHGGFEYVFNLCPDSWLHDPI